MTHKRHITSESETVALWARIATKRDEQKLEAIEQRDEALRLLAETLSDLEDESVPRKMIFEKIDEYLRGRE